MIEVDEKKEWIRIPMAEAMKQWLLSTTGGVSLIWTADGIEKRPSEALHKEMHKSETLSFENKFAMTSHDEFDDYVD